MKFCPHRYQEAISLCQFYHTLVKLLECKHLILQTAAAAMRRGRRRRVRALWQELGLPSRGPTLPLMTRHVSSRMTCRYPAFSQIKQAITELPQLLAYRQFDPLLHTARQNSDRSTGARRSNGAALALKSPISIDKPSERQGTLGQLASVPKLTHQTRLSVALGQQQPNVTVAQPYSPCIMDQNAMMQNQANKALQAVCTTTYQQQQYELPAALGIHRVYQMLASAIQGPTKHTLSAYHPGMRPLPSLEGETEGSLVPPLLIFGERELKNIYCKD